MKSFQLIYIFLTLATLVSTVALANEPVEVSLSENQCIQMSKDKQNSSTETITAEALADNLSVKKGAKIIGKTFQKDPNSGIFQVHFIINHRDYYAAGSNDDLGISISGVAKKDLDDDNKWSKMVKDLVLLNSANASMINNNKSNRDLVCFHAGFKFKIVTASD